jgi:hypothetical protein
LLSNFIDLCFYLCEILVWLIPLQDHVFLVSLPPLPEGGPLPADLTTIASEAPEAEETQDGDEAKDSKEGTSLTASPPTALSEDIGANKKKKCVDEVTSSSTSEQKTSAAAAPCLEEGVEMFDLMDS